MSSRAVQRKCHQVARGVVIILVFEGKIIRLVQLAGSPESIEELE